MVAKITIPLSAEKTLRYNEQKVEKGKAVCLGGENCLHDPNWLTMQKKLAILEHRNALNDRAKTKTLHVSLNFGIGERLSENKLRNIASFYMDKIGFGEQPYFIYQHHDAGHPHIHIVSTTIREDGSRITTHNIGRNQSEMARKVTERQFGLIKNEQKNKSKKVLINNASKAMYGKGETTLIINSIVNSVIHQYNYSSQLQLNAVLRQYNIIADRGKRNGKVYQKRGLYYRMLDEKGNKIGVPIKASALQGKPTLSYLEQRFQSNQSNRATLKQNLEKSLNDILIQTPETMAKFQAILDKKDIALFWKKDTDDKALNIIFIDNNNKCVFNESEMGKEYSLAALQSGLKDKAQELRMSTNENIICNFQKGIKHQQRSKLKNETVKNTSISGQLMSRKSLPENTSVSLLTKNKKGDKRNLNNKD